MEGLTDDVVLQAPGAPEIIGKAAVREWVGGYFGAYETKWEKTSLGFTVTDSAEGTLTVEQHGGRLIFTTLDLWKRAPGFSGTLYFSLPDVEAFYRQVKDKTPIAWPLQRMAYGSHEFGLVDGNGYTLAFVQGV